MFIKRIFKAAVTLLLASWYITANAASISLSPSVLNVLPGQSFELTLSVDFSDNPTSGGAFDVVFDNFSNGNGISYALFMPSFPVLGDFTFLRGPDAQPDRLSGIAFGDFFALSGPGTLGTLTFSAQTPGLYNFSLTKNTVVRGDFLDAGGNSIPVVFNGASVTVQSPVPLPGAFWLFGGAVFGFIRLGQKKSAIALDLK